MTAKGDTFLNAPRRGREWGFCGNRPLRLCLGLALVVAAVSAGRAQTPQPTPTPQGADKLLDELYPGKLPVMQAIEQSTGTLHSRRRHLTDTEAADALTSAGQILIRARRAHHGDPLTTAALVLSEGASTTEALRLIRQYAKSSTETLTLMDYLEAIKSQKEQDAVRQHKKQQAQKKAEAAAAAAPEVPARVLDPANSSAVAINRATAQELIEKLGIDARRARMIIQFRQLYGGIKTPEDLAQVNGLNEDMVQQWEEKNLLLFD